MCTAQDFIRRLLEVNPTSRMSLTDALRHPWLDSSPESPSSISRPSALARYPADHGPGGASELSELSEEDDHGGANGDASMISAVPSSSDMLGVQALSIDSLEKARTRRRSDEVGAHSSPEVEAAESATSATTLSTSNRISGTGGKRRRLESSSGSASPGDAAMDEESADSDEMRIHNHPRRSAESEV